MPTTTNAALLGGPGEVLHADGVRGFIAEQLEGTALDGRSVCILVPDGSRSCPLPLLLGAVTEALRGRASAVTVLIALGTHPPMPEAALARHLGYSPGAADAVYPGVRILQHEWADPATFATVGELSAADLHEASGGRLPPRAVPVRINRAVAEADVTLVLGPVFPHEVVGFSGGDKYLFPGVSGREMIDVSHWLGALISSSAIIGTRGITPVRAVITKAAQLVPTERLSFSVVVRSGSADLHAIAFGTTEAAWAAAADVSAETHVRYLDSPVRRVLSLVPDRYDELWTAAKAMYKVEPIVADGGEVVVYGPRMHELSVVHGDAIRRVGYHCREYFLGQWDRFAGEPWGVLAHSTHLRGIGTYADGVEHGRIEVTLATGIDEETTRAVGLSYRDPASIDIDEWRADPDTLVVENAGETLYRLR
ncbi:MAG: lactate racemase [Frankiaceae bacterium]|nr:lactate racemase [Frankiaceae bacterium]